jgi:hypothetical protein
VTNRSISSYKNLLVDLETNLKDLNRHSNKDLPIKLRYQTPSLEINDESSFVVLLGEQHPGSKIEEINFLRSNKCVFNTIKSLAQFPIKSFLKEGCSSLEPHPKLQEKTIDELLNYELSPLQIYINKINENIPVQSIENDLSFIYYALLSFLYSSRPGNSRFREIEMKRIEYLIADLLDSRSRLLLAQTANNRMIQEIDLINLIPEKFLKKFILENDFEEFKLLGLRSNIESLISQEVLKQFDLRINKSLIEAGREREYRMVERINSLEPNLYLALVGDYHLPHLTKLMKEKNIPTMVLSVFNA